jgi:hypothetical protein
MPQMEVTMGKKFGLNGETMALTIVLWLCSLPLIRLVVLPLFGRTAAATTALALLVIMLIVCWSICGWHVLKKRAR